MDLIRLYCVNLKKRIERYWRRRAASASGPQRISKRELKDPLAYLLLPVAYYMNLKKRIESDMEAKLEASRGRIRISKRELKEIYGSDEGIQ